HGAAVCLHRLGPVRHRPRVPARPARGTDAPLLGACTDLGEGGDSRRRRARGGWRGVVSFLRGGDDAARTWIRRALWGAGGAGEGPPVVRRSGTTCRRGP